MRIEFGCALLDEFHCCIKRMAEPVFEGIRILGVGGNDRSCGKQEDEQISHDHPKAAGGMKDFIPIP
jgi:hypothetical protein